MHLHYIPIFAAAMIAGGAAFGQAPKPGLSLQNEIRLRYEQKDSADFSDANKNNPQDLLGRLRLGLRWTGQDGSSVFLQPQFSFDDTKRALGGNGTDSDLHVHQLYLDAKAMGLKVRAGRQELAYGDERLLGNANWLNKGRSWDGVKLTTADAKTRTDIFGGTLGQFDYKTNEPTLAGVYSPITHSKNVTYDLYVLYKNVGLSATTHQSIYAVGTRPVVKACGPFDARFEGAYQFGSYAGRPVSAYVGAAVVGYSPRTSVGLRLFAEYDHASGGDPTSGTYRTFDQLFPTNHMHYGLADFVGWRNMQDIRIGAQAKPATKLSLSADGHFFRLASARDFWYGELGKPAKGASGATLRDPSGAAGTDLGTEFDLTAGYAVNRQLNVAGGYARFVPGSFVKTVNAGKADASSWFYVQGTYAF